MPVAVVAHDAGGAEIISSYVRQNNISCIFSVEGPAETIFSRKLGVIDNLPIKIAVEKADKVFCGSSPVSDFEWHAMHSARDRCKHITVFLDHWANYPERFIRDGITVLPDEIIVHDKFSHAMAIADFPDISIKLIKNPYLLEISSEIRAYCKSKLLDQDCRRVTQILYVCEPTSEYAKLMHGNKRYWGYTETEALRFTLLHLATIDPNADRFVVRPHPSESLDKYKWILYMSDLEIELSEGRSLAIDIANSDVIIGCNTMAMVVGIFSAKRVLSSIPPGGPPCLLPHSEIVMLRDLIIK